MKFQRTIEAKMTELLRWHDKWLLYTTVKYWLVSEWNEDKIDDDDIMT